MPDIPMLSGWGNEINQFGQGLGQLINPHQAEQNAFKAAALRDPQMVAQMAEMERSNPGTLAKMGLGRLAGQITPTPITPEMDLSRQKSAADITQTKANTDYTNSNRKTVDETRPFTVSKSAAEARKSTTEANVGEATEGDQIKITKAGATAAELKSEQAKNTLQSLKQAIAAYPDLGKIDIEAEAAKVHNGGKIDSVLMNRIQSDGAASQVFEQYLKAMAEKARNDVDQGIAALRGNSKSEKSVAFTEASKALAQAQAQQASYMRLILHPPSLATKTMAESDPASKAEVDAYEDARKNYGAIKEQVDKYRKVTDYLHKDLMEKAGVDVDYPGGAKGGTPPAPGEKPATKKDLKLITPNTRGVIDKAKTAGLDLATAKRTKQYQALSDVEKKSFDESY